MSIENKIVPVDCFSGSHELIYFVGCFVGGRTQVQFEFDSEEIYFVNFQKPEIIYTVPICIDPNPNQIWASLTLRDILENRDLCLALTVLEDIEEEYSPDVKGNRRNHNIILP